MPPMSVLSAPPPPPPGSAAEPPIPGGIPKLSLSTPAAHPPGVKPPVAKPGLNIKVAAEPPMKVGGKPVAKPGVLRKRPALNPVAKAGIAVVVVAIAIGGVYSYRIFFPAPSQEIKARPPVAVAPPKKDPKDLAAEAAAKAAAEASKLVDSGQKAIAARKAAEQAKLDAAANLQDAPTPTPASEIVMAPTTITTDVKVNSTRIDAAPAASAAFRTFVAGAGIGGVFQGTPSRSLINGSIVREGQTVESSLNIVFDHIDVDHKVIYFKDSTGAVVSKNY